MIDLHTHTTASDGRCPPADLVARAASAGVTVLSVTDHDTLAGCADAAAACRRAGIAFVPGIEITAVCEGADVHVLGYWVDPESATLLEFIAVQRQRRLERIRRIVARLAQFGMVLDADAILKPGLEQTGKAAGRPWVARALVAGGFVADTGEAFDKWLARGRPAFVEREGPSPAEVFARVHDAGGIASLAHPGLLERDEWIAGFVRNGLDAVEAYHSDHDEAAIERYVAAAAASGVGVSGGSDYHGDPSHGASNPGQTSLPSERFDDLRARAGRPPLRAPEMR